MANIRQVHWATCKSHRNGARYFQLVAVLCCQQKGEKGIVVHFRGADTVVASGLQFFDGGWNLVEVVANACIYFHILSPIINFNQKARLPRPQNRTTRTACNLAYIILLMPLLQCHLLGRFEEPLDSTRGCPPYSDCIAADAPCCLTSSPSCPSMPSTG